MSKAGIGGFVAGFIAAAAIGVWAIYKIEQLGEKKVITYPSKVLFTHGPPGFEYASISGVLRGRDMRGGTHLSIECRQETKECDVTEIMQLSPSQVGIHNSSLIVSSWTADKIVLASREEGNEPCNLVRIEYDRVGKKAFYHRLPAVPQPARCKVVFRQPEAFTWEIASSPIYDPIR